MLSVPLTAPTILSVLSSDSTVLSESSSDSTAPAVPTSSSTVPPEPARKSTVLSVPLSNPTIPAGLASDCTVLPSHHSDSTVLPVLARVPTRIREFQIRLEDIFGNDLPKVLDPRDSIIFSLCELEAHVISVPNHPGARRGPAGGLPRARDGMGRLSVVRPGRSKCRTAVFGQDGGPHRVRHFSSGQGGGRQGMAGDG